MVATIMRHFVIIVTSNNTVIRWQRMKIRGHRRQGWKRRPQSKHKTALLIPGACYPRPSHISFLNCSLLFMSIYHSQCEHGFLLIFYGKTWPQTLAPPWHASARQSPIALAINSVVVHPGWQGNRCINPSRERWGSLRRMCKPLLPVVLHLSLAPEQCKYSKVPSKGCWRWLLPSPCLNSQT